MKKFLLLSLGCACAFGASLQEIQSSKKVKIGVRENLPPFSSQANGESEGFEVSLAKEIGTKLVGSDGSIDLVVIEAKDRLPMLKNGDLDLVVGNFSATPARAKEVDFSVPYLADVQVVVTRKADGVTKLSDLKGKKIIVQKGTTSDDWLKTNAQKYSFDVSYCEHGVECAEKMLSNEVDGYMHTNITAAAVVMNNPSLETGVKSVGEIDYICVGAQKGNAELVNFVNNAIIELTKAEFFQHAYTDTFEKFYKGSIDKKYLLIDDFLSNF
ncbi:MULTISPECIES: transporter substrate-binding domain-containing protein [unclassified Campylobacter]|uniref:transporter substrate-binding domain-containing protein n=1 Tax=unclassified Campylobacter TaxID=2593542 RepID=UPI0022EA01C0|nr:MULTISPECIES: transporter substrate-binding domain-containing protein [unclassified Campylobacter]MDA3055222.1 transporter substrate-binding domain-containing protein [Campylobacter sp. VBCF_07 NA4]MDA3070991.1 transporter substrate-binding domain-containing protein [Campylobacter sp. VBCF_08 NA3]WBR53925.1 transporter substrate-binding domain-containing protein [Campylobacter sp. VBCF_01 NA2]